MLRALLALSAWCLPWKDYQSLPGRYTFLFFISCCVVRRLMEAPAEGRARRQGRGERGTSGRTGLSVMCTPLGGSKLPLGRGTIAPLFFLWGPRGANSSSSKIRVQTAEIGIVYRAKGSVRAEGVPTHGKTVQVAEGVRVRIANGPASGIRSNRLQNFPESLLLCVRHGFKPTCLRRASVPKQGMGTISAKV